MKCIYCGRKGDNFALAVCKECVKLWNENWEKFMPMNDEYEKLVKDCEEYVKQAMTGHTCGIDAGGDPYWYYSSNCIGCEPQAIQHYRNATEMVIAWTKNFIQKNIMKQLLKTRGK